MNISEKLTTVSENVPRVFYAGYASGETAGLNEGYSYGFESGYNKGKIEGYNEGKNAGQLAEYDRFWDAFQGNGERTDYNYAFYGVGWSDVNFYPKYDIPINNVQMVFDQCKITDLKQRLLDCGVRLVFNNTAISSLYYLFRASAITRLPEVGSVKVTNAQLAVNRCMDLKSIDRFILSDTEVSYCNNTFATCTSLTEIRFNEGIRPTGLNLQWSPLSRASLENLVSSIAEDFTTSITVSAAAVSAAFPDRTEWDSLCNTRPNLTVTEV